MRYFVVFVIFSSLFVSCVKAPILATSYQEAMRVRELVIAVPKDQEGKPHRWNEAMLTTTSISWCEKTKTVALPDGNQWRNEAGFFCIDRVQKDNWVFQDLLRKNQKWKFRWSCTIDEPDCVVSTK